jgi:uncharacterized membrane protein
MAPWRCESLEVELKPPSRMNEPPVLWHRTRLLAKMVLIGTGVLLVLLVSIPFVVPHQSLPMALIVFISVFILITALIAGTAGAYLFLSRTAALDTRTPTVPPISERTTPVASTQELEHIVLRLLDGDEQALMRVLLTSRTEMLQRDLVKSTAFSDAKVSRLLDRLEARGLVVRERQGMTNRVRLTIRQQ